ncbi:putative cation exchanger C3A12.06c, partial [Fusarium oxysporum f. sp. albedinis]
MSRFIWISGYLDKPHCCDLAQSLPVITSLPTSRRL